MQDSRRHIAVFTGNRSEYGLQVPILRAIEQDPRLEYRLLVAGAHLKDELGRTLTEIEGDGFRIAARVDMNVPDDGLSATAKAIGLGVTRLSQILEEIQPDVLLIYGDRFEAFAAAIAASQMGIPTAHLEGGDYTEGGALDDSVRHAITKLAHLHFTTNDAAAQRVRRLGEEEWRIFNVGYPALDLIAAGQFAAPDEVYRRFHLDRDRPILIFTQHSIATEFERAAEQIRPSLQALETAGRQWGCQVIITYANDDAGGCRIAAQIETFAARDLPFVQVHRSLGRHFYHGVLNLASACVGNSSSGIKETPALGCPCVNIGSRQNGRLRAENVIDVDYNAADIERAIGRCLFDEAFRQAARTCSNPYGSGQAGRRIAEILATVRLNRSLIQKKMTY